MDLITRFSYMSNILFITSYFLLIRINMSLVFRVMTCQFGNCVSDHSNNLDLVYCIWPNVRGAKNWMIFLHLKSLSKNSSEVPYLMYKFPYLVVYQNWNFEINRPQLNLIKIWYATKYISVYLSFYRCIHLCLFMSIFLIGRHQNANQWKEK